MREIGSEFEWVKPDDCHSEPLSDFIKLGKDFALTFSGRTAFETVIRDCEKIKKVAFPSYCCKSMFEPFVKYGIEVEFYNVDWDGHIIIDIDEDINCDAIVICNYFGFHIDYQTKVLDNLRERGCVIIEDITHSLLSIKKNIYESDYFVASLRKWGALTCGGICIKANGTLRYKPTRKPEEEFTSQKIKAMTLKEKYLLGEVNDRISIKEEYLNLFSESNKWLEDNYSGLDIDDASRHTITNWNPDRIREKRTENARVLYEGLKNVCDISFLFPIEKMDCPLFVPIIIDKNKRSEIRNNLIKNNIYCPIHWPVPDEKSQSELYNEEMSLICDQRYTINDMQRIINVIKKG